MENTIDPLFAFPLEKQLAGLKLDSFTWNDLFWQLSNRVLSPYFDEFDRDSGSDSVLPSESKALVMDYLKIVEEFRESGSNRYETHLVEVGRFLAVVFADLLLGCERSDAPSLKRRMGIFLRETFFTAWGSKFAAVFKIFFNKRAGITSNLNLDSTASDGSVNGSPSFIQSYLAAQGSTAASETLGLTDNTWIELLDLSLEQVTEAEVNSLAEQISRALETSNEMQ